MFHKPFRVKSNTAIKGSDRRKLRADVGQQFPSLSEDDLREIVPNKDEISVMKVYTHAGNNVIAYCLHKNPIFFELDKRLLPTVYTVWRYPDLIPTFTTWPPVFGNLSGGADLMLPGVVKLPDGIPQVQKNGVCAINLFGNKAAVAIGTATMSTSDMLEAGMRGKGILVCHTYQDQLWGHGEKTALPTIAMETTKDTDTEAPTEVSDIQTFSEDGAEANEAPPTTDLENLAIDDSQTATNDEATEEVGEMNTELIEGAVGGTEEAENVDECDEDTRTPTEKMDELLYTCFLHSIKTKVKKSDLPLLTSNFKPHLLSVCPPGKVIDIKKSSYKKLSKFLGEMKKKGFIDMKELQKGVDSIVNIHREHPEVRKFEVPEYAVEASEVKETAPPSGEYVPPEIVELHSVNAVTLPLFQAIGYKKGAWLTQQEIRSVITEYVKNNELVDKSQVVMNPQLTDALLNKNEYDVTHLRWDELFQRCYNQMGSGYQITFPGQPQLKDAGVKKGKLPVINITTEQRTGNKKVTLVQNLEIFGIDAKSFAHKVQVGVAASTSIVAIAGKSAGSQVLIQGNQINYVAQLLLDEYKIPRKYIHGLEKAPKSGKKKR
ncbi:eukaryotic translation initiation factor 2D-like [Ptychodera flava]|uniref:eukaryotic translation initiation factor 2D-like n=1 Tax=Ptychodera flava TaxID=63121 RepID=UPI00396A09AE